MLDSLFGAAGVISLTGVSLFLFVLLMVEILLSPRMWCRSLCPGGALYAVLGARRVFRVKNDFAACTQCAACIKACPMGLNPMSDALGIECDNCLACLPSCQPDALHIKAGLFPSAESADSAKRSQTGGNQ
jgi:ferredoxin-type protein NapH